MKTLQALSIEMDFFLIIVFCFKIQQVFSQGSTERELISYQKMSHKNSTTKT